VTVVRVTLVGLDKVKTGIRGLDKDLTISKPEMKRLFRALGKGGANIAKKQITSQGGGNWPKLSKWTRAQTNRRKALTTERAKITYRMKPRKVEVVYPARSNDWNLTKHHQGFTGKATGKKVTVKLRNPAAIRWDRPAISFVNRKDSVVPARNVWGTLQMHQKLAQRETFTWMTKVLAKRVKR